HRGGGRSQPARPQGPRPRALLHLRLDGRRRGRSPVEPVVRVLLTGPFGNVGTAVRREIAGRGHDVRCFDAPTPTNRARARSAGVDVVWGDIRDAAAVRRAAADRDVVVHLAAIIPPGSIRDPVLAESVNVGGTTNVIAACQAADHPVKIVYTSSLALF